MPVSLAEDWCGPGKSDFLTVYQQYSLFRSPQLSRVWASFSKRVTTVMIIKFMHWAYFEREGNDSGNGDRVVSDHQCLTALQLIKGSLPWVSKVRHKASPCSELFIEPGTPRASYDLTEMLDTWKIWRTHRCSTKTCCNDTSNMQSNSLVKFKHTVLLLITWCS